MDLIKRPKKVQRAEKGYMTNEKYQDYSEDQFKIIYDKTDEIIEKIASGYEGEQGPPGPPGPERTTRRNADYKDLKEMLLNMKILQKNN